MNPNNNKENIPRNTDGIRKVVTNNERPDENAGPAGEPVKKPSKRPKLNIGKFFSGIADWFKSLTKKQIKTLIIIVVAIVVVIAAIFSIGYLTLPVKISKVETLKSLSSRTENAPVQNKFRQREPIMLRFEFHGAQVGAGVKFEVKNQQGEVVKSGTTTILRPTGADIDSGQRFVSIVNVPSTALPIGKYNIVLSFAGRIITTVGFEVTE